MYASKGFFSFGEFGKIYTVSSDVHIRFQQFIPAGRQHGLDITLCVFVSVTYLSLHIKKNDWGSCWRGLAGEGRTGDFLSVLEKELWDVCCTV